MARQIVVVDVETNGLDETRHEAVEVAGINLATGESNRFIPPHEVSAVLQAADIQALRVNRYLDRIPGQSEDELGADGLQLAEQLQDNILAGATPSFDAMFLRKMYRWYEETDRSFLPLWHHRLLDLSAYAAGVLGLDPHELPGLAAVCERLGVTNYQPHTATGDVRATAECFRRLIPDFTAHLTEGPQS